MIRLALIENIKIEIHQGSLIPRFTLYIQHVYRKYLFFYQFTWEKNGINANYRRNFVTEEQTVKRDFFFDLKV